jgi:integrase
LRASDRPHAACMRFLLLTLARRGEGESARWRDIDPVAGTWTIRETKNGQPHVVPLSTQAKDLLREQMPGDAQGNLMPPDNTSLVFATGAGTVLGNWDREAKRS